MTYDPDASLVAPPGFDAVQDFGKEQLETAAEAVASFAQSFQAIVAEAADYSKKSVHNHRAFVEKLRGAKSFESVIQIHSEHAKTSYTDLIGYVSNTSKLYSALGKEAFKPIGGAIAKVHGGAA